MPGKELVVDAEPADRAMIARVGVQRLLLRGERVEQCESGLAIDVLVVPLEQELDRNGDPYRRLDQRLCTTNPPPKIAAGILGSTAVSGIPIAVPNEMPPP
jgi:hypothetical protein